MSLLTLTSLPNPAESLAGRAWPEAVRVRASVAVALATWRERRRTRQHLDDLDDRLLADVGLSRTQQRIECAKAPWQP